MVLSSNPRTAARTLPTWQVGVRYYCEGRGALAAASTFRDIESLDVEVAMERDVVAAGVIPLES